MTDTVSVDREDSTRLAVIEASDIVVYADDDKEFVSADIQEVIVALTEADTPVSVAETEIHVVAVGPISSGETTVIGSDTDIIIEAGEDLAAGDPIKVIANKAYKAYKSNSPHIVGIAKSSAALSFPVTICTTGKLSLSGLTAGVPYFLGEGVITPVAPSSGFVVRVGMAVTASVLLVNIEEPVLLV